MTMNIIDPGFHSTVQDMGRNEARSMGISRGGVMDRLSVAILNILVGNEYDAAVLEMFQTGVSIRFEQKALVALGGAEMTAEVDGQSVPLHRPLLMERGAVLRIRGWRRGVWGYLAIAGGIDVVPWLRSRSTDVKVQAGGFHGRRLLAGDKLSIGESKSKVSEVMLKRKKSSPLLPGISFSFHQHHQLDAVNGEHFRIIRVIHGEHTPFLNKESGRRLFEHPFRLSTYADRMGYRMHVSEEQRLQLKMPLELPSRAVTPGTIQLPRDGCPIVLMADSQTVGGYPVIGYVSSIDLPRLAQTRPGESVVFRDIPLTEAHRLIVQQHRDLQQLKAGVKCIASI